MKYEDKLFLAQKVVSGSYSKSTIVSIREDSGAENPYLLVHTSTGLKYDPYFSYMIYWDGTYIPVDSKLYNVLYPNTVSLYEKDVKPEEKISPKEVLVTRINMVVDDIEKNIQHTGTSMYYKGEINGEIKGLKKAISMVKEVL